MILGLTGGIASGKSTVAAMLVRRGAGLVDADQVSRDLVVPGSPLHRALVESFGEGILAADGTLDRAALGRRAFTSREDLERLNALTHPPIWEEIRRRLEILSARHPVVVLVAPLLLEHGGEAVVDQVWVVAVPEEVQVERLVRRDGLEEQEARARLAAQMPTSEKVRRAHVVIDNSRSLQETERAVEAAWHRHVVPALDPADSVP